MRTAQERWERDMSYLQGINATLTLGPARPIDYLAMPEGWLIIWQGLETLVAVMVEDCSRSSA